MRNKRLYKKGEILTLNIEAIAFGGKGIAKIETEKGPFTVFVQNAYPGQRVNARVSRCKNRYAECGLVEVLDRAPEEQIIEFQEIPGAPYAHVPAADQQRFKEETTFELFRRIGQLKNPEERYEGFVASPGHWHYRNKMEYSFSSILHDVPSGEKIDGFGLGFKHRGTWWAVENLDGDSGLFDAEVENAMPLIRAWLEKTGLPAWHPPKREGFFRFLVIRRSLAQGTLLVNLVTHSDGLDTFDLAGFVELIRGFWGDRVAGILHTVNDDTGERVEARSGETSSIYGATHITETLHGLDFDIQMSSFFQTNPACAEQLYTEVIAGVEQQDSPPGKDDVVMDLFCGTGTIAQLLVRHTGAQIVGVDIVETAIEDAKQSAESNGMNGIRFHAADVGKFLLDFPEYKGKIHTIVLDPPRAGISPKTLRKVMRLEAKRIVYVSCNPATQARDLATLSEWGYELKSFKLVDQFPHTAHVESVAIFERTNETLPEA